MLPFFFLSSYDPSDKELILDEDTSRHIVHVLRMKNGEKINLTDGLGTLLTAEIIKENKKHCTVVTLESVFFPKDKPAITIAISLLKNTGRFEWFIEKSTEIGVSSIVPLYCERTEKEKFRVDRARQICISAMLQSQQVWLPLLHQPIAFELLFRQEEIANISNRFIAHCEKGKEKSELASYLPLNEPAIILIGPEGDFTPLEIALALQQNYLPVSLGNTRLRAETAGIAAATLLQLG